LAIFVIGNCQNEFIDEAQDVDENSDLQERSEDEAQYFDSEELSVSYYALVQDKKITCVLPANACCTVYVNNSPCFSFLK
jgi:hypothetical protein